MDRNVARAAALCQSASEKTVCSPKLRRVKRQMRIFLEMCGRGQKAVSIGMGVNSSTITHWTQDGYPDAMGIHYLPDWTREVGPELEDWLQEQNDGAEDILALENEPPLTLAALLALVSGQEVSQLLQDIQAGWDPRARASDVVGLHKLRAIVNALIAEDEGRGGGL